MANDELRILLSETATLFARFSSLIAEVDLSKASSLLAALAPPAASAAEKVQADVQTHLIGAALAPDERQPTPSPAPALGG